MYNIKRIFFLTITSYLWMSINPQANKSFAYANEPSLNALCRYSELLQCCDPKPNTPAQYMKKIMPMYHYITGQGPVNPLPRSPYPPLQSPLPSPRNLTQNLTSISHLIHPQLLFARPRTSITSITTIIPNHNPNLNCLRNPHSHTPTTQLPP